MLHSQAVRLQARKHEKLLCGTDVCHSIDRGQDGGIY